MLPGTPRLAFRSRSRLPGVADMRIPIVLLRSMFSGLAFTLTLRLHPFTGLASVFTVWLLTIALLDTLVWYS